MPTGYREVSHGRISLSSSMPLLSKRDGRDLRLRRNTVPVKHSLDRWKKLRPPSFGTWPIWKRRTPTVPQRRKGVKLVSARTTVRCPLPPIPVSKLRRRAEKENSSSFPPPPSSRPGQEEEAAAMSVEILISPTSDGKSNTGECYKI